jgi:signal transduction histidine kinase
MRAWANDATDEARRLIAGLRPQMLDLTGLPGAIRSEVEGLRRAGWEAEIEHDDLVGTRLDADVEITLYRVAQEALS